MTNFAPSEEFTNQPILAKRLIKILNYHQNKFSIYALAKRANISPSSLGSLIKGKTRKARIKLSHAALIFENLSIPLENAVKATDYEDPHFRIDHCPKLEGPAFTHSDAENLLKHVMVTFVELLKDNKSSVKNRHQLAAKLKKKSDHIYRGFPVILPHNGQIIFPLHPPTPEMENLNKIAVALDTTLSKVIKMAKKRVEASRTTRG